MEKAFVAYTELKMPSRSRRANADWDTFLEPRRKALVDTLERRFVSPGLLRKWLRESPEDDEVEDEVDLLNPSPECPTCRQRRPASTLTRLERKLNPAKHAKRGVTGLGLGYRRSGSGSSGEQSNVQAGARARLY